MQNKEIFTKEFISTVIKTILISVAFNLVILIIARLTIAAPDTFGPFMYSPVILLTLIGVIGAALVYVLLKKYSKNYTRVFKIISYIALLLSLIPDFQLPYSLDADDAGATPLIIMVLIFMHIVTALIVIYYFTKDKKE